MPLAELKKELIDLVRDFGSVRAEKSFLLHSISQEMLVTFGSSVSVDAAAVERFRLALLESEQSRLLKKIFLQDVRFTLAPEAARIIGTGTVKHYINGLPAKLHVDKRRRQG